MSCLSLPRSPAPVVPVSSAMAIALALLAGALLPVQAAMNARLAQSLQSVPLAALHSYLLGSLTLIGLLLSGLLPAPDWRAIGTAPRWTLLAGVLGAWYVSSSTLVIPRLGATLTLGLVVAGQAVAGLVMDHHGWLGVRRQRLGARGWAAMALFLAAMVLLTQSGVGDEPPLRRALCLLGGQPAVAGRGRQCAPGRHAALRRGRRHGQLPGGCRRPRAAAGPGGFRAGPIERLAAVPPWALGGGMLGALYVTLSTLVIPRLGLTATTMTVVCSQLIGSLLIDHWGWLGSPSSRTGPPAGWRCCCCWSPSPCAAVMADAASDLRMGVACAAFVVIGAVEAALGVLVPSLLDTFTLSTGSVTLLLVSQIVGYLLAALLNGMVSSRLGLDRLLLMAFTLLASALLLYALTPAGT